MASSSFVKRVIICLVLVAAMGMFGCSYKVATKVAPAINIYSSYEDKIPGKLVLVVDKSCTDVSMDLKPTSYMCSAHTFPVKLDTSLSSSIRQTTEAMFEEVIEQNALPSQEQMKHLNASGVLLVRLNRFSPSLRFTPGFWEGSATASCEMVIDVMVKDAQNTGIVTTAVGGSRTCDGSAGSSCSGGADILSEAISKCTQDTMERFAERISNSQKVRDAFQSRGAVLQSEVEDSEKEKQKLGDATQAPVGRIPKKAKK
jgi:hypothetical protein